MSSEKTIDIVPQPPEKSLSHLRQSHLLGRWHPSAVCHATSGRTKTGSPARCEISRNQNQETGAAVLEEEVPQMRHSSPRTLRSLQMRLKVPHSLIGTRARGD